MNHVAHIAHSAAGGASDLCASLAIAGKASGCRQTIAFWGNSAPWPDRMIRCATHGIETSVYEKSEGLSLKSHGPIYRWALQHRDCDAIIVHYPPALFALRAAFGVGPRPRILLVEHHSNALKSARKWLTSWLGLWLADGVVYLTPKYREEVAAKLGRLFRPNKTAVISNGLDLARYAPPAERDYSAQRCVFGMAARFLPIKDHPTLVAAFADLVRREPQRDLRLELAGDGPEVAAVQAQIKACGVEDRVQMLGALSQEDLIKRMSTWDVDVLSTLGETQSLAVMEAMAAGLPLLSTRVAGVKEAVTENVNGLLVPAQNVVAMSEAMGALASDPALRQRLSEAALEHSRAHHSIASTWQGYQRFVESLRPSRQNQPLAHLSHVTPQQL